MAKPFASLSPAADHFSLLRGQQQQQQQEEMSCRWRGAGAGAAPFTAAQWQELETQALIFKYFVAGVPVPPDLLMAVRTSFEAMAAARYYHHSLGYGAYFGKKVDPEPGRCRRTDGKKWRCAKEAAPDSKYCERHMHRGRNRSRKPVESQQVAVSVSVSHPPSPSGNSTITSSLPSPGNGNGVGMGIGTGMEMGIRNSNGNGTYVRSLSGGTGSSFGSATASHLQIDPASYRYPYGVVRTAGTDEQRLFSEASGNLRGLSNVDAGTTWRMTQSPYSLNNSSTGTRDPAPPTLEAGAYQLPQAILTSSYTGGGVMRSTKLESCGAQAHAALHPFLDEWPRSGRNIGCWPELGDGNSNSNSNRNSFSSTQLSISIPMASSDFSTPSSCSPDDVQKSEDL